MILKPHELEKLVFECDKLIADKDYKSPECYTILALLIEGMINISGYVKYPTEMKEQLILDAIIRCYTKIPRFSEAKANAARAKSGHAPNHARAIHSYCEVIIVTSFLTSLSSISKKQMKTVSIDCAGIKLSNKSDGDDSIELAYIDKLDIDGIIDAETVAERARLFEERLDRLEKQIQATERAQNGKRKK